MPKTLEKRGNSNKNSLTPEVKERIKEVFLAQLNRKNVPKNKRLKDFAESLRNILRTSMAENGPRAANLFLKVISSDSFLFSESRKPYNVPKTGLLEIISTDFRDPLWQRQMLQADVSTALLSEVFSYLRSVPEIAELLRAKELNRLVRTSPLSQTKD